ncbi:hypothetical protein M5689_018796 [Euphorbia peplus]|nr:hypothetical protein M5689_018796 [Euphorbia peplus]
MKLLERRGISQGGVVQRLVNLPSFALHINIVSRAQWNPIRSCRCIPCCLTQIRKLPYKALTRYAANALRSIVPNVCVVDREVLPQALYRKKKLRFAVCGLINSCAMRLRGWRLFRRSIAFVIREDIFLLPILLV